MTNLPKARVARLVECHKKQKAGYNQHASPNFPNTTPILNVLIKMKNDAKSDYTIKFTDKALTYLNKHCNLKVKDIDLEQKTIYPSTAKHGSARALKISNNLQTTLQDHIIRNNLNPNDKLFKGNADDYGKHYRAMRNRLAKKLNDPTIQTIRLYDFRHYFATTYHKTRDILYTKQQMGHNNIRSTLIYTQLLNLNDDE